MDRLISEHGTRIVDAVDAEGNPIFWDAVGRNRFDAADILLDYAKRNGIPVKFKSENGDLLSRAIAKRSDVHVEFILDKLTRKYGSLTETIELLGSHYSTLESDFTKIILRFLKEDRFTIDYARFEVPMTLFGRNGKRTVAMSTDHHPESWTMDGIAAKDLWIQNSKDSRKFMDTTGPQIKAVAKLLCLSNGDFWGILESKCVCGTVAQS